MPQSPLTIFTTAKPMRGQFLHVQKTAIKSWTLLGPQCQVLLIGRGEGMAALAAELDIQHIPQVACSDAGTPLVHSLIAAAEAHAVYDRLALVNADIILLSDFMLALGMVVNPAALLIGGRWNVALPETIDFTTSNWQAALSMRAHTDGTLQPGALDYFVFPRGFWKDLPTGLTMGRPGYDNYLIYHARCNDAPVVDITEVVTAVHPLHDYSHHPKGWEGVWKGPEAQENYACQRSVDPAYPELIFRWDDATHRCTPNGLVPNPLSAARNERRAAVFSDDFMSPHSITTKKTLS